VYFSGRVQGVGFRYTCLWLARGFEVAGHVRNLPDGRVELVAEGLETELDGFLSAIEHNMAAYIRDVVSEPESVDGGELTGFVIHH
jgi:acylphosphatase